MKIDFVGASTDVRLAGRKPAPALLSYFRAPIAESFTGIRTFSRIVYTDLWPGINLEYSGTVNQLKYRFVIQPGADPSQIRLACRGADLSLDAEGRLSFTTPLGAIQDDKPYAYQELPGGRTTVAAEYAAEAKEGAYGFRIGAYDPAQPLILDPALFVYSGFLGGAEGDTGRAIAVDDAGFVYVAGSVQSTQQTFPVKVGPDLGFNGGNDAFVAKVSADGSSLIYLDYIGGAGSDYAVGVGVDQAGNAYVAGVTQSGDGTFPILVGPDLTHNGKRDTFMAKVDPSGTTLLYSGFIGGSEDDTPWDMVVDSAGNAYVVGSTSSSEATFPAVVGPDVTYNQGADAFVAKVSPTGANLVYCGYIGGDPSTEQAFGVAVDSAGYAYVTGMTYSKPGDFPVKLGPSLIHSGLRDAFVAKVEANGTGLVYAGYIGGTADDTGWDVAVDSEGNAYVAGVTESGALSFPVSIGPRLSLTGPVDVFITKVKADGTGLIYNGYIGRTPPGYAPVVAVDEADRAIVAGTTETSEASFPVVDGPDLTFNGATDGFVTKVKPDGTGFEFSGYVGGELRDYASAVAVEGNGDVYVAGERGWDC